MLTILIGKSCSGKDYILKQYIAENGYTRLITATTRPKRKNEEDGVDYYFISETKFHNDIAADRFLEYREYNTLVDNKPATWYYGSYKMTLDPLKNYICVLDPDGARRFVDYYGKENCTVINIVASDDIRTKRAKRRSDYDTTEWDRRFKDDNERFALNKIQDIIDKTILNNFDS